MENPQFYEDFNQSECASKTLANTKISKENDLLGGVKEDQLEDEADQSTES